MTIDTRDVNNFGLSKFRIGAENGAEQICYYNRNKKDKVCNKFLAVRKETSANEIIFSIEKLLNNPNKTESIFLKIDDELKEFENQKIDNRRGKFKRPIQWRGTGNIEYGPRQVSQKTRILWR